MKLGKMSDAHKQKISEAVKRFYKTPDGKKLKAEQSRKMKNPNHPTKSKAAIKKMAASKTGTKQSEETIQKRVKHLKGKKHSPERIEKARAATKAAMNRPDIREKHLKACKSFEHRKRISATFQGISPDEWTKFVSDQEYCPAFNHRLKEHIRNKYGRVCVICGLSTLQHIDKNGIWLGRLAIDHVDENKMQGCNDWEWRLAPLCKTCHGKMSNNETHLMLQLLVLKNSKEEINMII